MHVKRVKAQPRDTDLMVRGVLRAMSPEERRSYLTELQASFEAKVRTLEALITEEEVREKKAALEYWARRQIFEDPALDHLAETVGKARVQIEAYCGEISDLESLVLLCNEELANKFAQLSRN